VKKVIGKIKSGYWKRQKGSMHGCAPLATDRVDALLSHLTRRDLTLVDGDGSNGLERQIRRRRSRFINDRVSGGRFSRYFLASTFGFF
jgi:hypothetical protein